VELYYLILIFITGLALGSFFNVVIFRFGTGRSIIGGRSECLKCRSIIRWFDLIPVASYFLLKGKCRNCKEKISFYYPIVELTTAIVLVTTFLEGSEITLLLFLNAITVTIFILILFVDIRYLIIPDKLVILLAVMAVSLKIIAVSGNFLQPLTFSLAVTSFFAILFIASKGRWIGLGDVKLIFVIGFLLGYPLGYLSVVLAVWLAFIFSILLIVVRKADMKTEIPFGSFLSASAIIFIIFSSELQKISQYFQ